MSASQSRLVSTTQCTLRRFPPEIIGQILTFATFGERRMPVIIKALRGSKLNHDLYKSALFYYYSQNPMTITSDNVGPLRYMTETAAEPVRELRIIFDALVQLGEVSEWINHAPNGEVTTELHRDPDVFTITPYPKWNIMMKFSGLRTLHLDLRAYPAEKLYMVRDIVKNSRDSAPGLDRLFMDVKLPLQLPIELLENIIADIQVPERHRIDSVWTIIMDVFWQNLPPSKFNAFIYHETFTNLSKQDIVARQILPDIAGFEFEEDTIMAAVEAIEREFIIQANPMAKFINSINWLLESNGRMTSVKINQYQTFFWNIEAPKRRPIPEVGLRSKRHIQ